MLVALTPATRITLPQRRAPSPNRHRLTAPPERTWETEPITGNLSDLGAVEITEVSSQPEGRAEVRAALAKFHYLGYRTSVGENLQYVVRDGGARLLAVLVFGAAAWKCAARDQWIGWSPRQREERLGRIANNSRFLILPKVPSYYRTSSVLSCLGNSGCCSTDGTDKPAWTLATAA